MGIVCSKSGSAFYVVKPVETLSGVLEHDNLFFISSDPFSMKSLIKSVFACATLITVGCSENSSSPASQLNRMTNGVPLALDDELQNRKDGKWYWKDTTNLFTGIELNHHTNGVLKLQLPFTNGVPHGHRIMWHSNGQKESEGNFENGARAGLWKTWYPSGQPDKQGKFVNGKPEGMQIFWHTNGVKSVEWMHRDGIPHGEMKAYHPNGKLKQQGDYLEGRRNSQWMAWDKQGVKIREALFLKGNLVTEKLFDESPEAKKAKPAPQGDGR